MFFGRRGGRRSRRELGDGGRDRGRGVSRPGKGEGSLHLYHRSIWLWPGCDLELPSFEMPVHANKSDGFCDVALRCAVLAQSGRGRGSRCEAGRGLCGARIR